ncbi:LysR family substrate-binding domain-containing protein [Streptomyces sp. S.PB5]|uniref:LysR family substrate-binding domain-containing protein n=1 Tax=Streptomyces sp. S.PB5 TaxID=3020844 RepID=UPI0025B14E1C|nr:LysR family substrate-binding domain-containing protein [Streptomyces sp. S.PB5]MDN3025812.1 LysR family substrate-binding domain-containing protein [Streptomyces sp. S.PB5]
MTGSEESPQFRLAYVPGATPAKWVRIWQERLPDIPLTLLQLSGTEAVDALREGAADAGLVRLPVDRTFFSAIPLYTETTVVVVPKDHVIAAVEEVALEDLADETVLHPLDDVFDWDRPPGEPAFERPATTEDAVELVAAGIGVLVVPQSLARLYHRRDLTYRPVTDGPESSVALSWPEESTTDLVEDFIGIVRGRTVNSTRGRTAPQATETPKKKARAAQTQAKQPKRPDASGGRRKPPAAKKAQGAKRGKPRRRS